MLSETYNDQKEVLSAVKYLPSISIILPFEPKIAKHRELEYMLQQVIKRVGRELMKNYPDELANPVIEKLRTLIRKIDYSSFKRSIALYVSPIIQKVFYLDIPVEEKVMIDETFEIRDLVYSKKDIHKYLILVLSAERSRIFVGNTTEFLRIASNTPEHSATIKNDIASRVGMFSDPSARREILLDKFLSQVDRGLDHILNAYSMPLFVMGTEKAIGHFKKLTKHAQHIINYVHGNFDDASEAVIRSAIAPVVADWKKVKQNELLLQLEASNSMGRLSVGMKEVWKSASRKTGKLLIVEKNYQVPATLGDEPEKILTLETSTPPFYIKDAVDDVIQKVLENGGDVEFVDEGVLLNYNQIALIRYY